MRARTAVISMACAAALLLSGCSGGIPGVPQIAGGANTGVAANSAAGQPSSAAGQPTGGAGSDAGGGQDSGNGSSGDGTSDQPGSGGDASSDQAGSGDGGDTGLPPASETAPSLPSGIGALPSGIGALPSGLGAIPGVNSDCLNVAGILMAVGVLFLAPTLGGKALTKQQVDQAFAGIGEVPAELKAPVQVLHDAAVQAIGKSATEAAQIVGSDKVSQAMDALSKYTDAKCSGS